MPNRRKTLDDYFDEEPQSGPSRFIPLDDDVRRELIDRTALESHYDQDEDYLEVILESDPFAQGRRRGYRRAS